MNSCTLSYSNDIRNSFTIIWKQVTIEDSRSYRMCQNICITLHLFPSRKSPVILSWGSVMILNKCNCLWWTPSNHPKRLSLFIRETPILTFFQHYMKNTLGIDIKSSSISTSGIYPINKTLSMVILIMVHLTICVWKWVPILPNSKVWFTSLYIIFHITSPKSPHKI